MDGGDFKEFGHIISGNSEEMDLLFRARLLDPPSRPGLMACLDHFEILRCIGVGGMGMVFLARDALKGQSQSAGLPATRDAQAADSVTSATGELLAIKLLKPGLLGNSDLLDRFFSEARIMQSLAHPNIIRVLEVSSLIPHTFPIESNGPGGPGSSCPLIKTRRPYFVMPYLSQGNLTRMIRSAGPLENDRILSLAHQIASALSYAHGKGVIHRDLKPNNILIDALGRPYLSDFGLARTESNSSGMVSPGYQRVGTAVYMSPSIASGEVEYAPGDVYAFGVILYEMLTGQPPYWEPNSAENLKRILEGPPKPIVEANPSASADLVKIAEGAMQRNLSERYSRMTDIVEDLERMRQGRPPLGPGRRSTLPAPGPGQGPRKGPLFGRKLIAGASVVVLASVLGLMLHPGWLQRTELEVSSRIALPGFLRRDEIRLSDWNRDGHEELITVFNRQVWVMALDGTLLQHAEVAPAGAQDFALDLILEVKGEGLKGEGLKGMVVHWRTETNLTAAVLNNRFLPLRQFLVSDQTLGMPSGAILASQIESRKLIDLNQDGRRELLVAIRTDAGWKPRGLLCFDFDSQDCLWSYTTGPELGHLEFLDINGDRRLEILAGSGSTGTGHVAPGGTDDAHSYLYALLADGHLNWVQELGGPNTRTTPLLADLNGDGQMEILAWTSSNVEPPAVSGKPEGEFGRITRLDYAGNIVADFDARTRILSCAAADLHRDGKQEIIATDNLGTVYVLDEQLRLIRKRQLLKPRFNSVNLRIALIEDLDGDGKPELVLTTAQNQIISSGGSVQPRATVAWFTIDNRLVVLDSSLSFRAQYVVEGSWKQPSPWIIRAIDWDVDGAPEILSLAKESAILKLRERFNPLAFFQGKLP